MVEAARDRGYAMQTVLAARSANQSMSFFGQTRRRLEEMCALEGVSSIHAKDLFRGAYKEGLARPWVRQGIPKRLVQACESAFAVHDMEILQAHRSQYDGSVKFLIGLADQSQVEMVLMPESKRITLCVSSQVGCAQGCVFCHTGRMGLIRNLDAAEIVGQVTIANAWIQKHPDWLEQQRLPLQQLVTNIVFMGMGEPLDNVPAVSAAISILTDPYGLNMAMRRISVSTAGHIDGISELTRIHQDVRLAISIHSPIDTERSKIMPINRKWSLTELISTIAELPTQRKNGVLIQYTVIQNVNDSIDHARKLVDLLRDLNVKVNLIPLNQVGPSRLRGPEVERLEAFRDEIFRSGLRVMVRYSKGQDIAAACGQLVRS